MLKKSLFFSLLCTSYLISLPNAYAMDEKSIGDTRVEEEKQNIYKKIENFHFNRTKNHPNLGDIRKFAVEYYEKTRKNLRISAKDKAYFICIHLDERADTGFRLPNKEEVFMGIDRAVSQKLDDPFLVFVLAELYEKGIGTQQSTEKADNLYLKGSKLLNRLGVSSLERGNKVCAAPRKLDQ